MTFFPHRLIADLHEIHRQEMPAGTAPPGVEQRVQHHDDHVDDALPAGGFNDQGRRHGQVLRQTGLQARGVAGG